MSLFFLTEQNRKAAFVFLLKPVVGNYGPWLSQVLKSLHYKTDNHHNFLDIKNDISLIIILINKSNGRVISMEILRRYKAIFIVLIFLVLAALFSWFMLKPDLNKIPSRGVFVINNETESNT